MSKFSRRDFMKFTVAASGTLALSKFIPQTSWTKINQSASLPNVLIFVFDAMSAKNLSVYGYPRKTSPNLERFAERATVFNAHYSAGSFTTPGTASLLTGLYPWTHRAINEAGLIARDLTERNIFKLTGEDRYRVAYSQNIWPNYFFGQFQQDIDKIISPGSFGQVDYLIGEKFDKSLQTNLRAFDDFLFQSENPPASLVFGLIERILFRRTVTLTNQGGYPNGLPRLSDYPLYFRLQDVFDGVIKSIENLNPSYMAYFHFWPPHDPYNPTKQFYRTMDDGWSPVEKPDHPLGDHVPAKKLYSERRAYDEFIASADDEFGRLLDFLESRKILDNSYVIVTADHGELFERGERGHISPLLYEAGIRIPLLISAPGQTSRQDVHTPTNSVDLLPTLVHLSGHPLPDWREGELLPVLGGQEIPGRSMYTLYALKNPAFKALFRFSVAMRKDNYKMIFYRGYYAEDHFELYDLEQDPEELNDLYPGNPAIAVQLREELLTKLEKVNAGYPS